MSSRGHTHRVRWWVGYRGAVPSSGSQPPGGDYDAAAFTRAALEQVGRELPTADLSVLRASLDLIRVATRLTHRLESAVHRPTGWSMAGFRVMFCVWITDELEPRQIARLSGLSRAAVSSVLNTLERDGLIERSRESDDRRLVTVRLTEAGRQGVLEAYSRQNDLERQFFDGFDAEELATLDRLLSRLLGT